MAKFETSSTADAASSTWQLRHGAQWDAFDAQILEDSACLDFAWFNPMWQAYREWDFQA